MPKITLLPLAALLLGLAACNPNNPADRALGGAVIGANNGAAVGSSVAGAPGAAIGAATDAGLGAPTGALTTPPPPVR
jgi:hypothetical protein